MNETEEKFWNLYRQSTGIELLYEVASFHIDVNGVDHRYVPDFYCPVTLTFFEVCGTRQAFHEDKFKIHAFQKRFPHLNLKVVNPDGSQYQADLFGYRNGSSVPEVAYGPTLYGFRRRAMDRLKQWVTVAGVTERSIASQCGLHQVTISNIINGKIKNISVKTASKLSAFLDSVEQERGSSNPN